MSITYDDHSLKRINERKVEEVWIQETLLYPDKTVREGNKYIMTKRINGKTLEIVIIKERNIKIKTLYWL